MATSSSCNLQLPAVPCEAMELFNEKPLPVIRDYCKAFADGKVSLEHVKPVEVAEILQLMLPGAMNPYPRPTTAKAFS